MFRRIYLDNSATTPIDERTVAAMMPYLTDKFGNASSIHHFGQEAKMAVDRARHDAAVLIGARPNEIIFTSGGTEANNLALRGFAEANAKHGRHIITSEFEHSAVKEVCQDLEKRGFEVTYLPVYENGIVRPADIEKALREDTILVSVMTANNEIGTIQPVEEIGALIKNRRAGGQKIFFHTDAVQAAGKFALDVEKIGCDLLTVSAHKIYAPKGCGALYARRGVRFQAQNIGGHQERERRGGTESVALIAAFGEACRIARQNLDADREHLQNLRDTFEKIVFENISGAILNGEGEKRLPHISNISFGGIEGEGLLINLDMQGVAVSTGAACSSGSLEPSPVIRALGRTDAEARGAIRFSFGKFNTADEVQFAAEILPKAVENLRRLSPSWNSSYPAGAACR